ncbi:hypothetical protein [Streptomyces sp. S186]|uniref:hypothetical protein n=1 Tax=Streptomyces sp. S186 TaxID=3434395 RepID=UPI003F680866
MTTTPTPAPDTKPGLNLYDRWQPTLEPGEYHIDVTQTVSHTGWTFKTPPQAFTVGVPRYSIAQSEVAGCFPAPGAQLACGHLLPYVSLRDPYLPWETGLNLPPAAAQVWGKGPWPSMTLLILADGEVPATDVRTGQAHDLMDKTQVPADVVLPDLTHMKPPAEAACTTVDLPAERFDLLPKPAELVLMAHVREPLTPAKGQDDTVTKQPACSEIIAIRLPTPALAKQARHYTAHLVSLVGQEQNLTTPPTGKKVRLVSLYSWSFSSTPDPGESATEAFSRMQKELEHGGSGGRLRYPDPGGTGTAAKRLKAGYVPTAYQVVTGERTTAWYRGPLMTADHRPKEPPSHDVLRCADEALVYLPEEGMFDISLAVAWTLGCQLVYSRRDLCDQMLRFTAQAQECATAFALASHPVAAGRPLNLLTGAQHLAALAEGLTELADPGWLRRAFVRGLDDGFGDRLLTALARATAPGAGGRPVVKDTDRTVKSGTATGGTARDDEGDKGVDVKANTERVLADPATAQALRYAVAARCARHMHLPIPSFDDTGDADTYLWDPVAMLALVPTWYLLPLADAVLPPDSVRVFHLDDQWLSAFADGMLTVGSHTGLDALLTPELKKVVFKLQKGAYNPACGMLMRSPVLRHWPQDPPPAPPITRSRLDAPQHTSEDLLFSVEGGARLITRRQLGPETALLLFDKVPTKVVLREPAHVLEFGFGDGDGDEVILRNVKGEATGETVKAVFRSGPPTGVKVLDAPGLLEAIKRKQPSKGLSDPEFMAFQLLHPPALLDIDTKGA